jgi:hypothetical protein
LNPMQLISPVSPLIAKQMPFKLNCLCWRCCLLSH